MNLDVSHRVLAAIRHAFTMAPPGKPGPEADRIVRKAQADGWIAPVEIESMMLATDPRLYRLTVRETLRTFGIPLRHVFERPARGERDAEGIERISVVDLARLLIALERIGLEIDAGPLCSALAPGLGAKRLLTAEELTVHWRAQRRSDEPVWLATRGLNIGCAGHEITTPSGYTVRTFLAPGDYDWDDEGAEPTVEMLTVEPPVPADWRPAPLPAKPAAPHMRKYLGQPRAPAASTRPTRARRRPAIA